MIKKREFKSLTHHMISGIFLLFLTGGCNMNPNSGINQEMTTFQEVKKKEVEIAVEAPPFTEGMFPCSDCHSYMESNAERRNLEFMHEEISAEFDHGSENRWCLDCHDESKRDSLRLANGDLLDFKESYKLCGQCHGVKLRDWRVGVHGKRTGEWNGQKEYLLCVHCHNPHNPPFKEMTPEPPPVSQKNIKISLQDNNEKYEE